MKINIFYRKKNINQYSIEKVFNTLIPFFSNNMDISIKEMPFMSKGFFRRIFNVLYSAFNQSEINHISGDIHYVNLLMKKKRTILTIHDVYPLYGNSGIKKYLLKLFWFKIPIRKSQIITTISQFSKNEILNYFDVPKDKVRVINNCVSPLFQSSSKEFNKETPVILHVGTKENKNLTNLIDAIKNLNAELIIVGNLSANQKRKLNSYQIAFKNYQNVSNDQLYELYKKCDILSFISFYEGFGLPIIEAQAVGRPVITSNVASMPEIAGEGALLVNPFSISEISDGIKRIIKDSNYREKLVLKGKENIKRFDAQHIANQYVQLYKEILSDN